MAKGQTTANDILKCLLKGTNPSYSGNATLYVALHSADPTVTGLQTANEVAYTDYLRKPITKATGWTETSPTNFTNAALIQFPVCGAAVGATVRYISIGSGDTGVAGQIYYIGQVLADLTVTVNVQPQLSVGSLSVTES